MRPPAQELVPLATPAYLPPFPYPLRCLLWGWISAGHISRSIPQEAQASDLSEAYSLRDLEMGLSFK